MEEKKDDALIGQEIRLERNVFGDVFVIAAKHKMFQDPFPIKGRPVRQGFGKL